MKNDNKLFSQFEVQFKLYLKILLCRRNDSGVHWNNVSVYNEFRGPKYHARYRTGSITSRNNFQD